MILTALSIFPERLSLSREPAFCPVGKVDQSEHKGDLYQDAYYGCQDNRRAGPEEGDGNGYGELKEVGGTNHTGWCGYIVAQLELFTGEVGNEEDKDRLDG